MKKNSVNTFDEILQLSLTHGRDIFQIYDQNHVNSMNKMSTLMQNTNFNSQ